MSKRFLLAGLFLAFLTTARADPAVAEAQQALKNEGFYYGQVNGEKNTDTGAAIRRFQIRNGLEITGDLNDETIKSLRKASTAKPTPVASLAPPPARTAPVQRDPEPRNTDPQEQGDRNESGPDGNFPANSEPQPPSQVYSARNVAPPGEMFTGTPYQAAPPEVQRQVVTDAQKTLARRGLYKSPINGTFGPDLEFSLRAYQSRVGLRPTGRLDLETLAALELLPGAHERVYNPRRLLPPGAEPPVRGEWIRP